MVRSLENRRRQEIETAAGGAGAATDELKQAQDKWIQFLDDTKRRAEERKVRIAAQQSSHPSPGEIREQIRCEMRMADERITRLAAHPSLDEQAREELCRQMAEQREARRAAQQSIQPTQPTLGDQAREQLCRQMAKRRREAEGDQSDGDTSGYESSGSPSERRRNKIRRLREQERETELYTTVLANALNSFATAFSNSLSRPLCEPIQGVENELKELKTSRNELRN